MQNNIWYDTFLEAIRERFPKKSQMTRELINLLCLEREAVYRRLRKTVPFLAHEVVKIADAWNISLDEITGIKTGEVLFQMQPFNYLDPSKQEFANMQKRVRSLDHLPASAASEYMEASNKIPRPLIINFHTLYRFRIFNWASQYNNDTRRREFSKIVIPEMVLPEFVRYKKNMTHVKNSHYIFDKGMFDYMVSSTQYFHSILLITDKEKALIKQELHKLLDYLLDIANNGCYPETQNKVTMYISQLNIDTNYSYMYSDKMKACRVHAFGKFDVTTFNSEMVAHFKNWMNLKRRSSIQISEVNEQKRIAYFAKQRELVDTL